MINIFSKKEIDENTDTFKKIPLTNPTSTDTLKEKFFPKDIITCKACRYVGEGESARRTTSKIIAWMLWFFFLPTILYYLWTDKNRCPQCKSTSLTVKNTKGVFVDTPGFGRKCYLFFSFFIIWIMPAAFVSEILQINVIDYRIKTRNNQNITEFNKIKEALYLYAKDHNNTYPLYINDLIPVYLDRAPQFAFSSNGAIGLFKYATYGVDINHVVGFHMGVRIEGYEKPLLDEDSDCIGVGYGTTTNRYCIDPRKYNVDSLIVTSSEYIRYSNSSFLSKKEGKDIVDFDGQQDVSTTTCMFYDSDNGQRERTCLYDIAR